MIFEIVIISSLTAGLHTFQSGSMSFFSINCGQDQPAQGEIGRLLNPSRPLNWFIGGINSWKCTKSKRITYWSKSNTHIFSHVTFVTKQRKQNQGGKFMITKNHLRRSGRIWDITRIFFWKLTWIRNDKWSEPMISIKHEYVILQSHKWCLPESQLIVLIHDTSKTSAATLLKRLPSCNRLRNSAIKTWKGKTSGKTMLKDGIQTWNMYLQRVPNKALVTALSPGGWTIGKSRFFHNMFGMFIQNKVGLEYLWFLLHTSIIYAKLCRAA